MFEDTHLLTVNEDIATAGERTGDVLARAFEMRFQVGGGLVVNVYPEASEAIFLRNWDPWYIEALDDMCDTMTLEQLAVHGGGHGAEKEAA